MTTEEYITPKEIAAALKISLSSAYTLVRKKLAHNNVSTGDRPTYRVSVTEFNAFMTSNRTTPQSTPPAPPQGTLPPGVKRYI